MFSMSYLQGIFLLNNSGINIPGTFVPYTTYGYIRYDNQATTISNTDGYLDGHDAMTWLFFIRMSSQQDSTILQYSGSGGHQGFTFGIAGNKLFVLCKDGSGYSHYFKGDQVIPTGQWVFVGFTFNKLWVNSDHIDLLYFSSDPVRSTHAMGIEVTTVDAHGDIMIGQRWDGSAGFVGDIGCIQFYNTSLLGGTLEETISLCDSNQGEYPGIFIHLR